MKWRTKRQKNNWDFEVCISFFDTFAEKFKQL